MVDAWIEGQYFLIVILQGSVRRSRSTQRKEGSVDHLCTMIKARRCHMGMFPICSDRNMYDWLSCGVHEFHENIIPSRKKNSNMERSFLFWCTNCNKDCNRVDKREMKQLFRFYVFLSISAFFRRNKSATFSPPISLPPFYFFLPSQTRSSE